MRKEKAKLFNDDSFQIEIFRLLENISREKGITSVTEWAEKAGIPQPDLSKIISAKKGLTQDKFEKIISAIGVTSIELKEIEKEARKNIYERKYGEDLKIIPTVEGFNLLDELDLDEDFIKSISLSVKGKNADALKKDLKATFEYLVNVKHNDNNKRK